MKNKNTFWMYLLIFAIVIVGATFAYKKLSPNFKMENISTEEEAEKPKAIDFEVVGKDGNKVSLLDYEGKPIVLNFWASWCGPCKMEMPHFQEVYEEMGEEIQFFMVNATAGRETMEKAQKYIDENGYTLPFFFDTERNALSAYGINAFPTTFFINSDGEIIAAAQSAIDKDTLLKGINMIK